MRKTAVVLLLIIQSCTLFTDEGGTLVYTEAAPEKGFSFPYFLFIPDSCSQKGKIILVVEPNNSGFTSDDFTEHMEQAERTAKKDFYLGNYIARNLQYPLLVPVFPREKSTWKMYTPALDRDVMMQKDNDLERIDLQLLAMVEDANARLRELGYTVGEKFFMTGFSASGTFANRFTLLHPDRVLAMAAGGLNGLLMLPQEELVGEALDYPIGTNDFELLFGKAFDSASFKNTPQFLFMGAQDDNDAIPYQDAFDDHERSLIYELLGEEMQPQRWNKCIEIYNRENVNARFRTYRDLGHDYNDDVREEILAFFRGCLPE